jgi:hypothetical protein
MTPHYRLPILTVDGSLDINGTVHSNWRYPYRTSYHTP